MTTPGEVIYELIKDCGFNEQAAKTFIERNRDLVCGSKTTTQICNAIVQRERVACKLKPEDDFPSFHLQ